MTTHRITFILPHRDAAEAYVNEYGGKVYKASAGRSLVVRDVTLPEGDLEPWELRHEARNLAAGGSEVTLARLPEVGMDATYTINGDSYSYKVKAIKGNTVICERNGAERTATWYRADGCWSPNGYGCMTFGFAADHLDPSF